LFPVGRVLGGGDEDAQVLFRVSMLGAEGVPLAEVGVSRHERFGA
jgi:hypothetical protein